MIKITCCRCGSLNHPNMKKKGQFILEFKNIGDFALWFVKAKSKIFFPKIKKELTSRQIKSLVNKSSSLLKNN